MADFFNKLFSKFTNYDEDDDYAYEDDVIVDEPTIKDEINFEAVSASHEAEQTRGPQRVVGFRPNANQQLIIVAPTQIDAAQEICNHIQTGRTVICNFEKCDGASPQRILDFINGAAYALGGQVKRVSSHIFLVIPQHVNLISETENTQSNLSFLRQAAR